MVSLTLWLKRTCVGSIRVMPFVVSMALLVGAISEVQAQNDSAIPLDHFYVKREKSNLRVLLSKINVEVSLGGGTTFMRHQLGGLGIYQPTTGAPTLFRTLPAPPVNAVVFNNWITTSAVQIVTADPAGFRVFSDTATLGFKGRALNIPLKISLYYEFSRFRVGGGYSYEYMRMGDFRSLSLQDKIRDVSIDKPGALMRKYYGMFGVSFFRYQDYLFVADVNVGDFQPKPNFNQSIIVPSSLYANFGVTIERGLSEYFKGFIRPNFEIKNYVLQSPGIKHSMNAFYINFGFTYRLPELRRCFLVDCKAQINHAHGNREYRSRQHPVYKKQNPGYGENNKVLIKYKGKNKRKLNPY